MDAQKLEQGIGRLDSRVILVGEAPGANEITHGEPFVGRSGQLLTRALKEAGLYRNDCYITNTVLCRPEGNDTPKASAVKQCKERLIEELNGVAGTVVIALGAVAMKALLPGTVSLGKERGKVVQHSVLDKVVIPTYHPAAVLRNIKLYSTLINDLRKAANLAMGRVDTEEKGTIKLVVVDTPDMFDGFIDRLAEIDTPIALDVENVAATGKLICVGVSWTHRTAVVTPATLLDEERTNRLSKALRGKHLVGHRLRHDLKVLWQHGFDSEDIVFGSDTMIQSYLLDETIYADKLMRGAFGLKKLVADRLDIYDYNHKIQPYYSNLLEYPGDMYDVWEYNGKDAAYTLELYDIYNEEMDDTVKHLMTTIANPASDALVRMEYLGTRVDRQYLIELSLKLDEEINQMKQEMFVLADKEFNPNSPSQLVQLLYKDLDLTVPGKLSTKEGSFYLRYKTNTLLCR